MIQYYGIINRNFTKAFPMFHEVNFVKLDGPETFDES